MIKFKASLPPIQSAISLDGNGDGARIKLDVSRTYVNEVILLQRLAGKVLEITVKEFDRETFELP
jgi:hypothetical protein